MGEVVETLETVVLEDKPITFPLPKFSPILLSEPLRKSFGFNYLLVLEVVETIFGKLIPLTKLPTLKLPTELTFYRLPPPSKLPKVISLCWRGLRVKTSVQLPRRYRGAAIATDTSELGYFGMLIKLQGTLCQKFISFNSSNLYYPSLLAWKNNNIFIF